MTPGERGGGGGGHKGKPSGVRRGAGASHAGGHEPAHLAAGLRLGGPFASVEGRQSRHGCLRPAADDTSTRRLPLCRWKLASDAP